MLDVEQEIAVPMISWTGRVLPRRVLGDVQSVEQIVVVLVSSPARIQLRPMGMIVSAAHFEAHRAIAAVLPRQFGGASARCCRRWKTWWRSTASTLYMEEQDQGVAGVHKPVAETVGFILRVTVGSFSVRFSKLRRGQGPVISHFWMV